MVRLNTFGDPSQSLCDDTDEGGFFFGEQVLILLRSFQIKHLKCPRPFTVRYDITVQFPWGFLKISRSKDLISKEDPGADVFRVLP